MSTAATATTTVAMAGAVAATEPAVSETEGPHCGPFANLYMLSLPGLSPADVFQGARVPPGSRRET